MAKKKKAPTRSRSSSLRVKGGSRSIRGPIKGPGYRYAVPIMVLILLIAGIAFMALSGYHGATASQFFGLRNVEVRGIDRTPREDIVRTVTAVAEKPGVWHSDLAEMKVRIEKFPFVRSASISRSLPSGIRVDVVERSPAATVRLASGTYLVDTEGVVLTAIKVPDKEMPFILNGWDESKSEKAVKENAARLKVYKRMVDEAKQFDIAARIKEFNLANLREPAAVIEDSGRSIPISLSRDELGKSLRTAIDAVTGKGSRIRSVDSGGIHPIIQYLDL